MITIVLIDTNFKANCLTLKINILYNCRHVTRVRFLINFRTNIFQELKIFYIVALLNCLYKQVSIG